MREGNLTTGPKVSQGPAGSQAAEGVFSSVHVWTAKGFICIEASCHSEVKLQPIVPTWMQSCSQSQPTAGGGYQASSPCASHSHHSGISRTRLFVPWPSRLLFIVRYKMRLLTIHTPEECHSRPLLPSCLIHTCDTGKGEHSVCGQPCSCSPWFWDSQLHSLCLAPAL